MLIISHPWSSFFQLGESQYFESWAVPVLSDGSYSALSPVLHGDIVLSINTKQIQIQKYLYEFIYNHSKKKNIPFLLFIIVMPCDYEG